MRCMEFEFDAKTEELRSRLLEFMEGYVYPAELVFEEQYAALENQWDRPPVIEELKAKARARGLWNLFLPSESGLTQLSTLHWPSSRGGARARSRGDQLRGARHRQHGAPAPDRHEEQQEQWLRPLLDGKIRSAFS